MEKKVTQRVRECVNVPKSPKIDEVLRLLPHHADAAYYRERTDRNIGWITREEQELLSHAVIGIAGCGGMGAQLAEKFLRLGVGEIRIADNEAFDVSNINRQFAASRKTVGVSKAFATARMLRNVSDDNTIVVYPRGICASSVHDFTRGCDVICDEIEFWAVGPRILLHQEARRENVPVFNCNTVGFGTRLFLFTPESSTMEELLHMSLEEGMELSASLAQKTASKTQIARVMESMLEGLVPELPDYYQGGGNADIVRMRLFTEGRASIIATNPPLATGFLADRVLLYLLRSSETKRNIVETPTMPAYLYFDAALMQAKVIKGRWR